MSSGRSPHFWSHKGIQVAGGSGNSNLPSACLILISQELAADKKSSPRSLDNSSRARRFSLDGSASAQRNTLVSNR